MICLGFCAIEWYNSDSNAVLLGPLMKSYHGVNILAKLTYY